MAIVIAACMPSIKVTLVDAQDILSLLLFSYCTRAGHDRGCLPVGRNGLLRIFQPLQAAKVEQNVGAACW